MFGSSEFGNIIIAKQVISVLRYSSLAIAVALSIYNICREKKKFIFIKILIIVIIMVCYYQTKYFEMIWLLVIVFSGNNINYQKTVKCVLYATAIPVIIVLFSAIVGLINNIVIVNSSGLIRQFFGFQHPNFLGGLLLKCYTCCIFLYYRKWKKRYYIYPILLALFCYIIISTRTAAVCILVATLLLGYVKLLEKLKAYQKKFLINVAIFFVLSVVIFISYYLAYTYNSSNSLYVILNAIFTNRLSFGHYFFEKYGFSLFGQYVEIISTIEAGKYTVTALVLDNAYLHLAIRCGLAVTIVVLTGFYLLVYRALKREEYGFVVVVLTYFVCGLSEKWLFMPSYNIAVLFLSSVIYRQQNKIYKSKTLI